MPGYTCVRGGAFADVLLLVLHGLDLLLVPVLGSLHRLQALQQDVLLLLQLLHPLDLQGHRMKGEG